MKRKRERKEKKAAQSQEERAQVEEKEKGEVGNVRAEERQQAEVMRRVAVTVFPYVDPPSEKSPR
jgi:hypothetical protein